MIKQEIVSLVKNEVGVIDPTAQFHPRVLEAVIEDTLREMYGELYQKNPRLLDNYTKQYGTTSPVAVTLEATTGIYYSTLPEKIINLPCSGSGVRHIYTTARSGNTFVPMSAVEADLVYNTDVASVSTKIGYRVRQDTRVDYWNTSATVRTNGVAMDLLIPFSAYLDDDVVMIPESTTKEGTFLARVLQKLSVVPQPELLDKNAAPTQEKKNKQ